uniref:Pre-mRNA-splicing factor RBM22 n=1 Tax=Rhabditophanes sp. KR3021 TaxID=114890 RepID=A0AC35TFV1_9BILA
MNSRAATDYNRRGEEDTGEFPILCETCLGSNPYLRMMKCKNSSECKVCTRIFTSFRWLPGKGARYKSTEICQLCAKMKNVCQTCALDLQYGLPVQVRDQVLQISDNIPTQGANRDMYLQQAERELALTDGTTPGGAYGKIIDDGNNPILKRLARTQPYYNRNASHICSFFVKGECKRGDECPYRHEMPKDPDNPLNNQNLKDRYYGQNDPVALKMLNKINGMPKLVAPTDDSITTLYVGGIGNDNEVTEEDLQGTFYQYGEVRSIKICQDKGCAFVQFAHRESADKAAKACFNNTVLKGKRLAVRWGNPQTQKVQYKPSVELAPELPSFESPYEIGTGNASKRKAFGMDEAVASKKAVFHVPTIVNAAGTSKSMGQYPSTQHDYEH